MYTPYGLEPWEVVAASGLFAWGILAVASVIGFTLAWIVFGTPSAERHPVVAAAVPKSEPRPVMMSAKPEHATPSPTAA